MLLLRYIYVAVLMIVGTYGVYGQNMYTVKKSEVNFRSNAPNEIIKAKSKDLQAIVDVEKRKFACKVDIRSFDGFNSPLQKEHFNENYMESRIYPEIIFSGKIIEEIDLNVDGEYDIRAKGKLKVHGKAIDRIINVKLTAQNGLMQINAQFKVPLADHDIRIPRVVDDKLATEVLVTVNAILMPDKE